MVDEIFLNDVWSLYFHDPNNNVWTPKSYQFISTIGSVQDFSKVMASIQADIWTRGMFFIMREHIQPIWEDPCNQNGGCFSMKVMRGHVNETWTYLCTQVLGETLTKNMYDWKHVNGVSISPKKNYCIIRVWIDDRDKFSDTKLYAFNSPSYTEVLFKNHVPEIEDSNNKEAIK